ncbi:hypothetical protein [Clostridium lacusfryxellense]|uniref:hypothetical protein n=1 Tax=Clostridium lacusfryxellense TaxID=205328 RepID=UPI001C0C9456|nr:hypothetical protein [Clostridium lacusfryxellense]MBU3112482.1 hypothetical protein [Clostridium lacusfryxellense]
MFKLIKYELRATFLTIIGICATVIIANLLLMTKKGTWELAVPALSIVLFVGAIIVIFISSLKIMSKYLYDDSGYLLFTLPQSGVSIIGSRLITALIQTTIVVLVSFLMFYFNVADDISLEFFFKNLKMNLILYGIFNYICMIFYSLTIIYFCMVIGKVALKGKKIGKIGSFIIFIILSMVIGWISVKITTLFPQNLDLSNFTINKTAILINSDFTASGGNFNINIAQTILDIIIFAGLFIGSSKLIDKKLDLS